jgi:hypothetical protein
MSGSPPDTRGRFTAATGSAVAPALDREREHAVGEVQVVGIDTITTEHIAAYTWPRSRPRG